MIKGSKSYENWQEIPLAILNKIYLFNITNVDEVLKGGKHELKQVGPFVYEEKREKYDIEWNSTMNFPPLAIFAFEFIMNLISGINKIPVSETISSSNHHHYQHSDKKPAIRSRTLPILRRSESTLSGLLTLLLYIQCLSYSFFLLRIHTADMVYP